MDSVCEQPDAQHSNINGGERSAACARSLAANADGLCRHGDVAAAAGGSGGSGGELEFQPDTFVPPSQNTRVATFDFVALC